MARIPIGLELYSVRNEFDRDPRGTLQAVAEMGYEGVEFAGPFKHPVSQLRAWLDEFKLVCCGWHCPFQLVQDDKLAETITATRTVGNPYVIVPGLPGNLIQTRADWQKMAVFFNELAGKLAPYGLFTGYHNHHIEFAPLEGETPWDTFFGNTKREVVMQLDTGNALFGGGDCVAILKRFPGRPATVHLKPYSTATADKHAGFKALIGEDSLPWQEIFGLCETVGGTKWYIVEYESDAYPPLEAVKRCLQNLKAMGK